jgi:hypothetical protein
MRHVVSYEIQGSARGAKRRDKTRDASANFLDACFLLLIFTKPNIKIEYFEVKLTRAKKN